MNGDRLIRSISSNIWTCRTQYASARMCVTRAKIKIKEELAALDNLKTSSLKVEKFLVFELKLRNYFYKKVFLFFLIPGLSSNIIFNYLLFIQNIFC